MDNNFIALSRMFLLGIMLLCLPVSSRAVLYYADPIEGWVVDAQTGKPIEDVIVTANWQLEGGMDSGIPRGQIEVLETVTDTTGKFTFPSWGPKMSFRWHASFKWPQILIFKRGYRHMRLTNEPRSGSQYTTKSDWHGKILKLSALSGSAAEFENDRSLLDISLAFVRHGEGCEWKRVPRLIAAYNKDVSEFVARAPKTLLVQLDKFPNVEKCGEYHVSPELVGK